MKGSVLGSGMHAGSVKEQHNIEVIIPVILFYFDDIDEGMRYSYAFLQHYCVDGRQS